MRRETDRRRLFFKSVRFLCARYIEGGLIKYRGELENERERERGASYSEGEGVSESVGEVGRKREKRHRDRKLEVDREREEMSPRKRKEEKSGAKVTKVLSLRSRFAYICLRHRSA